MAHTIVKSTGGREGLLMKKLCRDCKHYHPPVVNPFMYLPEACSHPDNLSLVDGETAINSPTHLRMYSVSCGEMGHWCEARLNAEAKE